MDFNQKIDSFDQNCMSGLSVTSLALKPDDNAWGWHGQSQSISDWVEIWQQNPNSSGRIYWNDDALYWSHFFRFWAYSDEHLCQYIHPWHLIDWFHSVSFSTYISECNPWLIDDNDDETSEPTLA